MAKLKMKEIRGMKLKDVEDRLEQARSEYTKMRTEITKGTNKKASGRIRPLKKNIARLMTRRGELQRE